ncbi:histidine kinase [Streptomyces sp. NPDC005840]|uniref:ATP-binding protein n=1 Tax=Streptomyces sp. NPDC005840 TaxID=3157072 RepID=UPI003407759E
MNANSRVLRDDRSLPLLLLCAQAAVWPGARLAAGAVPPASALLVAALVGGTVTAALAARRTRPVAALVLVAAACALGAGQLPVGGGAVLGTAGVALALFTVAAERDTFTTLLCLSALALWQLAQGVTLHGLRDLDGLDLVLTTLLYVTACGTGLWTRRAGRVRRTAERRLRRAESERHRLPAAERRRMERELHDVSAHHLTAVVVTAGAALGLGERRPELARQALEFAVETGHTVTRALGAVRAPAPSREELPAPQERLRSLVAGFRRLDQPVDDDIDPLPEGVVADAVFGIVREALTNVARHAPGAATTVVCRYGDTRTDVVVTSAAPPDGVTAHGAGLGGGRGQGFLRSRAREAGGTLSTGPTADGGWEVRALLPGRTAAEDDRALPPGYRVAQVVAALGLCAQPLLPVLLVRSDDASSGSAVSAGALFALLAAAQAVTLLWLRRAPRAAQAVLLALAALWPVAMAVTGYSGPVLLPPALGALVTCAAVALTAARTPAPPAPAPRRPSGGTSRTPALWRGVRDPRARRRSPGGRAEGGPASEGGAQGGPGAPGPAAGRARGGRPADPGAGVGAAVVEGEPGTPAPDGDRGRAGRSAALGLPEGVAVVGDRGRAGRSAAPGFPEGVAVVGDRARAGRSAAPGLPEGAAVVGVGQPDADHARALRSAPRFAVGAVVVQGAALAAAVLGRGVAVPAWAVVAGAGAGAAVLVGAAHRAGTLRGRRERDARRAGEERLAGWTGEAVRDAWAERRRIAAGLETTVLARTADMVAQAEAGRLDATADRARDALAAMRALLDTVRADDEPPALRPQPTLQALDLLAHQCRATGRDVEIRLAARVPAHLPTAVDLAAYHAAETLLAVGGGHPARIEIDADGGTLTLTATGVPAAARPAVRDRLAARVAALGGTLTTPAGPSAGPVSLLLPLTGTTAPAPARPDEERDR